MNKEILYHGTRANLSPGDRVEPDPQVYLTYNLDEAIWDSQLAAGDGAARVYRVEALGPLEDASAVPGRNHPSMSLCSRQALRVTGEVAEWNFYHGTRADLKPGDLITAGNLANFGQPGRRSNYVYFSRTLDAAAWGAELARGDGPGRIYVVEPSGPIEEDPNLTNRKFRGNPTQSYRSSHPLKVTGEITGWTGHAPEAVAAMKEGLERLAQSGSAHIDD